MGGNQVLTLDPKKHGELEISKNTLSFLSIISPSLGFHVSHRRSTLSGKGSTPPSRTGMSLSVVLFLYVDLSLCRSDIYVCFGHGFVFASVSLSLCISDIYIYICLLFSWFFCGYLLMYAYMYSSFCYLNFVVVLFHHSGIKTWISSKFHGKQLHSCCFISLWFDPCLL